MTAVGLHIAGGAYLGCKNKKSALSKVTSSVGKTIQKCIASGILFGIKKRQAFESVIKPAIGLGLRTATLPLNSMIVQNIIKGHAIKEAAKIVAKAPGKGMKELVCSTGTEYSAFFVTRDMMRDYLENERCVTEQRAGQAANFAGAIVASIASAPFDTLKVQQQAGGAKIAIVQAMRKLGVSGLYKGMGAVLGKNASSFGVGLIAGDMINQKIRPLTGDSLSGTVASKSVGWALGGFVGSPFFNTQMLMRGKSDLKGYGDVLKHMEVTYDPAKYQASKYQNLSLPMRTMLMTKETSLKPEDTGRLKAYHVLKNIRKFWKGFHVGLPVILLSGSVLALAEEAGKAIAGKSNKAA